MGRQSLPPLCQGLTSRVLTRQCRGRSDAQRLRILKQRNDAVRAASSWTGFSAVRSDPSFIITRRMTLDDTPEMYRSFRDKEDSCIKVGMRPE